MKHYANHMVYNIQKSLISYVKSVIIKFILIVVTLKV
jgi:hypothetical protein